MGDRSMRPSERASSIFEGLDRYLGALVDVPTTCEGKILLEIGAGPGNYVRYFAACGRPSMLVAVDLAPQRFQHLNGVAVYSVGADCRRLPFRDECFDVVYASLVLSVLSDLSDAIAEIRRVLKKPGIYLGIEPSLLNPLHWWRYVAGRQFPGDHPVSARAFKKAFRAAGFNVQIRPLSPKMPILARFGVGTCLGIVARKPSLTVDSA
jgi:ubiquinone/menaquinone biosynthesis C-methylase UbiE